MYNEEEKFLLRAWYSKEDGLYHVIFRPAFFPKTEKELTFASFREFFQFTYANKKHRLSFDFHADLFDSTCEGATPLQLRRNGLRLSSETEKRYGIYDPSFELSLRPKSPPCLLTLVDESTLLPTRFEGTIAQRNPYLAETEGVVFYISDLHLDWKIADKFPNAINQNELEAYFESIAKRFKEEMDFVGGSSLIVVGDISFNFKIVLLFFSVIQRTFQKLVYFVMGNHEYWDPSLWKENKTIDEVIAAVREKLSFNGVTLLENDLAFPHRLACSATKSIYYESELSAMTDDEIRNLFCYNGVGIFGGTGFSGLNHEFNANTKVYGECPIDRREEIKRSKRIETLHERLKRIVPENRTMVVATHMPITDWSNLGMMKGWYYLSGHTHNNRLVEEDGYHFLSDNQVGYQGRDYHLKFFTTIDSADIFEDRPDGQYEITAKEYQLFYETLWLGGGTSRDFERIIMLKKSSNYMFFGVTKEGLLYILDGGRIRSTCGHGLDYYYERMANYSNSIAAFLKEYTKAQKLLSSEIKKLGGRGTIHGCIIDLDPPGTPFSYNHIYLNPFDGAITPYFAEAIDDKYVYENVPSLLSNRLPRMFEKISITAGDKSGMLRVPASLITADTTHVANTEMYRISRLLKSLQYTLNYRIIRIWNYALADAVSAENGRLLFQGIANPDSVSVPKAKPFRMHADPNPAKPKKEKVPPKEKPKPSYITLSQIKQRLIASMKKECREKAGNTTSVLAISDFRNVECKCKICGNVWSTTTSKKQFVCPRCKGRSDFITMHKKK